MAANAQVYNSHGMKYEVPRRRVYSLNELQIGDHISFHQMSGFYWHHAIVEGIHVETDELDVIEYSNTAKEFWNGNCSPPRKLNDIEVVRGRYNFQSEVVYLMLHERCFDLATVVERARSKLGEKKYSPFINNCEHFAMWCKTGESSSDQVKKTADMMKGQFGKATCGALAAACLGKTATSSQTVTTGVRVVTKNIVSQTVTKMGKEAMKSGVTMTSNQVVGQTVSTVGKATLRTGVRMASNGMIQSVSRNGQEVVKTGLRMASIEMMTQSGSSAGQEFVKTGVRMASMEMMTQSGSSAGQEFVKTGVRMASMEMMTQSGSSAGQKFVKSGIQTMTKEVLEETVSTVGKGVVKTASSVTTTTTTKEVLTQSTTKSVSNSAALGVACGALFEGISTVYDISRAHEDMKKGNITREEFNKATGKRVMTGFGNFGGSSVGAVVGQAAIPIPLFGGLVGSVVGGLVGSLMANVAANATLDPH